MAARLDPDRIVADPELWKNLADEARARGEALPDQKRFYKVCMRHADDLEKLAEHAFRIRIQLDRIRRITKESAEDLSVKSLNGNGSVVSIKSG